MTVSIDQTIRTARQHLETVRLLGVDFVPVRQTSAEEQTSGLADTPVPEIVIQSIPGDPEVVLRRSDETTAALLRSSNPPAGRTPKSGDTASKSQALEDLRSRHDASCPHCTTVTYHQRTVFGEGDADADLMFIGEAPGEEEDRTGRPFVGRAGQKLNDIIKAMGLTREQVYIANILKSRPPDNRTPLLHEVEACGPFLTEQIRIIQPRAIVALGGPSAKYLLKTDTGITRLRGQWGWFEEAEIRTPVMPTFHPAFLLRQYTPDNRQKVWSDMQSVLAKLRESEN